MDLYTYTLKNGIRLVHLPTISPVAHCGIITNTGSRDELPDEHGMAHFIEHLIFKGTRKRKTHHILSRMEDIGGELNAFTTKEETCIHTTFFNNYYERAFDLMADILFQSVFPLKEIEKERDVIIDEIKSYKDSPIDQLYDDFEEQVFSINPIARNILGTETALKTHSRDKLKSFYETHYATNEIVVSSVGNIAFSRLKKYFEKYFTEVPQRERKNQRPLYQSQYYKPGEVTQNHDTYQAHCIIGNQAYSHNNEKRLTLHLLNNLLGGNGMNSRLNMALREKRGLAYNVESNYTPYSDTGIVSLYFGTDREDLKQCLSIVNHELKKLNTHKLGSLQLSRAKRQLIGQIAIGWENNENLMISNGRSMLFYNRADTLNEITAKIQKISASALIDVSNEIFDFKQLSKLTFV